MRTYEKTHPWITYNLDTSKFNYRLWMQLGEIKEKCQNLSEMPLRPSTAEDLLKVYLTKGALATTAIEGNTLSEDEARKVIDGISKLPPSKEYLGREIENVVSACNVIMDNQIQSRERLRLNPELIKQYNKMILDGLELLDDDIDPGQTRKYKVGVGDYRGAPPEDCDFLLEKMCIWINEIIDSVAEGLEIPFSLLMAILAHLYIAWIHPFGDGNGRTARLIEYHILVDSGMPIISTQILSNHYNQTRAQYYRQLSHASKSGGDVIPFIIYAVQGFIDGLDEQIDNVNDQMKDVCWRNYIYESFKGKGAKVDRRRRRLALDLSSLPAGKWVSVPDIPDQSVKLSKWYSGKTIRTISRDVVVLNSMGLVKTKPGYVRSVPETILAFLPMRKIDFDNDV